MFLCLFSRANEYAGFAELDESERLIAFELFSVREQKIKTLSDLDSMSVDTLTSKMEGDDLWMMLVTKHSGEPGFAKGLIERIRASGMSSVCLSGDGRRRIWEKIRRAELPKQSKTKYALALSIWPENDLGYWDKVLAA